MNCVARLCPVVSFCILLLIYICARFVIMNSLLYSKQAHYIGLSFATISASGPNASVIHYHPAEETNRQITEEEIYLCDSGAQYKYSIFRFYLFKINITFCYIYIIIVYIYNMLYIYQPPLEMVLPM